MLVVKTLESEFDGVTATLRELHSYELPEILSFTVAQGERGFLDWIAASVDKEADFADDDEEELAFAGGRDDDEGRQGWMARYRRSLWAFDAWRPHPRSLSTSGEGGPARRAFDSRNSVAWRNLL